LRTKVAARFRAGAAGLRADAAGLRADFATLRAAVAAVFGLRVFAALEADLTGALRVLEEDRAALALTLRDIDSVPPNGTVNAPLLTQLATKIIRSGHSGRFGAGKV
jgi:hypothetical protein